MTDKSVNAVLECKRPSFDLPCDINLNLRLHLQPSSQTGHESDTIRSNLRGFNGTPAIGSSTSSQKKVGPPLLPKPKNHESTVKRGNLFQDPAATPKKVTDNQSTSDAVDVFCRIRPLRDMFELKCVTQVKENIIQIEAPVGAKGNESGCFSFKKVLNETTDQQTVFQEVCLPMVKDGLEGKNGLVFTYGVTGSGKTHTLTGDPENPGIIPRTLDTLFNSISGSQMPKFVVKPDQQNSFYLQSEADAKYEQERQSRNPAATPGMTRSAKQRNQEFNQHKLNNKWAERTIESAKVESRASHLKFSVFVSYVEVYNNYIYDLLDDSMIESLEKKQQAAPKMIREDARKRVFVQGCQEEEISCASEGIEVLLKGILRRKIAQTALNAESSRSHSVFNIRVVAVDQPNITFVSQLSLVDLAGSERTGRTGAKGERLREAGNINNSLMSLRACLDMLRYNQKNNTSKLVPYRDSKITHLFKAYFEGEGCVKMIICINPSKDEYDETIQVMKFAEASQEVMVKRGQDIDFMQTNRREAFTPGSVTNFGPPAPTEVFEIDDNEENNNMDTIIPTWMQWLEDHKKTRENKTLELLERQQIFREKLAGVERESLFLRNSNQVLTRDLAVRGEQVKKLEASLAFKEQELNASERKCDSLTKHVESLEAELRKREDKISGLESEKLKLKENHEKTLRIEQNRIRNHYEERMKAALEQIRRESCLTKDKVALVQRILQSDSEGMRNLQVLVEAETTQPKESNGVSPRKTRSSAHGRLRKSAPEDDIRNTDNDNSNLVSIISPLSPGNPVLNPRKRRSSSVGNEKWLDHRPVGTIEMDTVLQHTFKKKKSVSRLTDQDLKQSSHYALTTNIVSDANTGEVETRVYKADVYTSLTGGTHVVFNDVEKLSQEDPISPEKCTRKRLESAHSSTAPESMNSSPANVTKRSRR
jgi:kinesin family protein 23